MCTLNLFLVYIYPYLYLVDDFLLPPSLQLVFGTGDTSACVNIPTQSDLIYEENELFNLLLTSTNPSIIIGVGSTVVEVTDDDSKPFLLALSEIYVMLSFIHRYYSWMGTTRILCH